MPKDKEIGGAQKDSNFDGESCGDKGDGKTR